MNGERGQRLIEDHGKDEVKINKIWTFEQSYVMTRDGVTKFGDQMLMLHIRPKEINCLFWSVGQIFFFFFSKGKSAWKQIQQ